MAHSNGSGLQARGQRRLTQQDAFFVAYQEQSAVAMQLGVEVELVGQLQRSEIEQAVARLVERWPHLGQTIQRRWLGLAWAGAPRVAEMLVSTPEPSLERWRNTMIDPFREPPFQLLWIAGADAEQSVLAFRAHHAALDGRSFFAACSYLLRCLASSTDAANERPPGAAGEAGLWRLWREGHLGSMWRYMRWLMRESKLDRSVRLVAQATEPGDIDVHRRWLDGAEQKRLKAHAKQNKVDLPWLCCAAWVRVMGDWNAERGEHNPVVSLEVPVSARSGSGQSTPKQLGNEVSPLLLFAQADQPLVEIAKQLKQQFVTGVRQRSHLAMPIFTAGGRYLPWWLFRRVAADTTFSGFATSHFTWLHTPGDLHAEVAELSGGRLELVDQTLYTPVCLHMGAALMVISKRSALQLSITHRRNALSSADVAQLAEGLVSELLPIE